MEEQMGTQKTNEQFLEDLYQKQPTVKPLEQYINNSTPIHCKCIVCGLIWNVRPGNLLNGHGCPACGIKKRAISQSKSHDNFIHELASINPDVNIIDKYKGARIPLQCKCQKCGHTWLSAPTNLLKGKRCPICAIAVSAKKRRRTQIEFQDIIDSFGHNITPNEDFKGNSAQIKMKCNVCGYEWKTTAGVIVYGGGCPRCAGNGIYSQNEFVKKMKSLNPFIEIISEYQRAKLPIRCKCLRCGNIWEARPNNLLFGKGCPACNNSSTSYIEQVILEVFRRIVGNDKVLSRNRKAIGKELDIFIPTLSLAFEPGSWKWHSNKLKNDFEKRNRCKNAGIRLISIYSDYDEKDPPFSEDCICVKETLGFENDFFVLQQLISNLLFMVGIESSLSYNDWAAIVNVAYDHSRRITTAEFERKVSLLHKNINIEGDYTGSWNRIECRCKKCGFIWSPVANSLLQGHGCKKCSDKEKGELKRKTHKDFVNELKEVSPNIELVDTYVVSQQKVHCHCLDCGYEWEAIPSNLLKRRGCPKCNKRQQSNERRKSPEQFSSEIHAVNPNLELVGVYEKLTKKIECKCLACGHIWLALPSNLIKAQSCPKCAIQKRNQSKYKKVQIIETGQVFESIKAAAKYSGTTDSNISACLKGRTNTASGYHWRFYSDAID